ncbi:hypothetical protein KFK09_024511 [Dendrobium nobile]|uniref:Uncharacterized protein n=1 Tax=Dendrobium nobile TaxID=94219 RepID=A0A8T3AD93_DENNO|nr:hypothetical protein KFK09_024511 [Dendrobium nobile]
MRLPAKPTKKFVTRLPSKDHPLEAAAKKNHTKDNQWTGQPNWSNRPAGRLLRCRRRGTACRACVLRPPAPACRGCQRPRAASAPGLALCLRAWSRARVPRNCLRPQNSVSHRFGWRFAVTDLSGLHQPKKLFLGIFWL